MPWFAVASAHIPRLAGRGEDAAPERPSGSIRFRADVARPIGTCVNWWFQKPTTMSVRPLMPACTALCPSSRQKAESWAVAGTLRIV